MRRREGRADLVAVLASTSTPDDSRMAADRRLVETQGKKDETRLALLDQILYAPGQSDAMRIYAMDQLADADAARAGKALTLYLPRMAGEVLAHACALAEKLGDVRVLDALVVALEREKAGAGEAGGECSGGCGDRGVGGEKAGCVFAGGYGAVAQ